MQMTLQTYYIICNSKKNTKTKIYIQKKKYTALKC
jgi:hypothetical protein